MILFVKMSDSCCRACQLASAMCESGLVGYGFSNDLVRSCATSIVRFTEDGMGVVKLEGTKLWYRLSFWLFSP